MGRTQCTCVMFDVPVERPMFTRIGFRTENGWSGDRKGHKARVQTSSGVHVWRKQNRRESIKAYRERATNLQLQNLQHVKISEQIDLNFFKKTESDQIFYEKLKQIQNR